MCEVCVMTIANDVSCESYSWTHRRTPTHDMDIQYKIDLDGMRKPTCSLFFSPQLISQLRARSSHRGALIFYGSVSSAALGCSNDLCGDNTMCCPSIQFQCLALCLRVVLNQNFKSLGATCRSFV